VSFPSTKVEVKIVLPLGAGLAAGDCGPTEALVAWGNDVPWAQPIAQITRAT
jgi:hypothetical protein